MIEPELIVYEDGQLRQAVEIFERRLAQLVPGAGKVAVLCRGRGTRNALNGTGGGVPRPRRKEAAVGTIGTKVTGASEARWRCSSRAPLPSSQTSRTADVSWAAARLAGHDPWVRHSLPDLAVWAGDRREPSSTSIAGVGAYVVVVASALPDRPVTLTSCFLGQVDSDTAVSHLRLAPDHQRHGPLGRCR